VLKGVGGAERHEYTVCRNIQLGGVVIEYDSNMDCIVVHRYVYYISVTTIAYRKSKFQVGSSNCDGKGRSESRFGPPTVRDKIGVSRCCNVTRS
jgi:hypothetical protein